MQTSQRMPTVLIDDNDPSIQYGPGWINKPSLLAPSDPNYPMYGTLHETVVQTNLTYSFSGSYINVCARVTGNSSLADVALVAGWDCYVDRVQIDTHTDIPTDPPTNLFPTVCCWTDVELNAQVQHEIHISAIGSQEHPISFDYLTYETSLAVPATDLIIFSDDPTLKNTEGWEVQDVEFTMDTIAMATTEPTANFTFDFFGSSILWFGFYNTTFVGYSQGHFSYSVDGNDIRAISSGVVDPSVAKLALNGLVFVNFLVFQTFALPRGQHRLEVNYSSYGPGKAIPLTLTQLVVQNSTINPNSSVPTTLTTNPISSVPTTTPTALAAPSAVANGPRRSHLAIILGCCGAAFLAFLILGIFFARRRMKRRDRAFAEIGPSVLVEPFNHDPASVPVGTHHKGQRPSEVQEQDVVETAEVQVEAPPSYITGPHDS